MRSSPVVEGRPAVGGDREPALRIAVAVGEAKREDAVRRRRVPCLPPGRVLRPGLGEACRVEVLAGDVAVVDHQAGEGARSPKMAITMFTRDDGPEEEQHDRQHMAPGEGCSSSRRKKRRKRGHGGPAQRAECQARPRAPPSLPSVGEGGSMAPSRVNPSTTVRHRARFATPPPECRRMRGKCAAKHHRSSIYPSGA